MSIDIGNRILKKEILSLIRTKGVTEQLDKEIFGGTTKASLLLPQVPGTSRNSSQNLSNIKSDLSLETCLTVTNSDKQT